MHRMWSGRRTVTATTALAVLAGMLAAPGVPAASAQAAPGAPAGGATVEPQLRAELATGDVTEFWVYLRAEADLAPAAGMAANRAAQGEFVYEQLTRSAAQSQAGLRSLLDDTGADYSTFWIANAVKVTGDEQLMERIAALPEVAEVATDRSYRIPEPEPADAQPLSGDVEWGIDRVNAPETWDEFGAQGQDVVVGVIDTGARFTHEALVDSYRGNQGDGLDHNYSWHDPSRVCGNPSLAPCDTEGHGTHVTGTIVGGNGIGMAPAATWIAAKGCEGSGCSQEALLSSGQFMLAPTDLTGANPRPELRPHIVNNSWGGDRSADPWYREMVRSWTAAGIFPQFAAGNSGPGCETAGNPGNLPESYAAGAFDIDGDIYSRSGRGASAWGGIKPDLAAPGVAVRSATHEGDNAYGSATGTSMASPHVAGAVALLWSAAPSLVREVDATRAVLDSTAIETEDLSCGGTPAHNNVWGHGPLDAHAAVAAAPRGPAGRLAGEVTDAATGDPVARAAVSITGAAERELTTGEGGGYAVTVPTGEYTVSASAFGYEPRSGEATVAADETTTRDLALSMVDHVTVGGSVTDGSGQGWPIYAQVAARGTPVTTFTDPRTGEYELSLPAGETYTLEVESQYPGYAGATSTVSTRGADLTRDVALTVESCTRAPGYESEVTVGVLGDWQDGVAAALDREGLAHETFDWGDDPSGYDVVVVNRPSDPGAEEFGRFLADTDAAGTGVLFLDNYSSFADGGFFGGSGGIWLLQQHTGNPAERETVYSGSEVAELYYQVRAEHPVVSGFEVGDEVVFDDSDDVKVYAWFDGYQGEGRQVIADVGRSDGGAVGPGIGVQQREQNRHALLSMHGASSLLFWAEPDSPQHWDPRNWADPGRQLFRNALGWVSPVSLDCVPVTGGLVLGQVSDRNTGDGLNDATVDSPGNPQVSVVSAATPDDPGLGDGFFWFFSSQTGVVEFTGSARRYVDATATVQVAPGAANEATVSLPAGRLEVDRSELPATVRDGRSAERSVTLTNSGTAPVDVELYERRQPDGSPAGSAAAPAGAPTGVTQVQGDVSPAAAALLDHPDAPLDSAASGPAADPWRELPDYPVPVMDNAMAVVDGTPYSFGGWHRGPIGAGQTLDDAYRLDHESELWRRVASLPAPRDKPEAVEIDGLVYVIGGWDEDLATAATTYIYDPEQDSWSQGADMPAGRTAPGVAVLDGQLYVVGGCTDSSCELSGTVWRYDPAADAWEELTNYPETTSWLACGGLQGRVFCAAGAGGEDGPSHATYSYDPDEDTWTRQADMPFPVWGMAYAAADGRLVLSSGVTEATARDAVTNRSAAYDAGTDTWTEIEPAGNPLYRMAGACGFYKVGGTTASGIQHATAERHPDFAECAEADIPWLAVEPSQATLAPGENVTLTVTVDAAAAAVGAHTAGVGIRQATPYALDPVTVALNVREAVQCDRTITGVHFGPLTVADGVTCLSADAGVFGPVQVGPDAGFVAVDATITGPVTATGAATVELVGGQVHGPVTARDTTGVATLAGVRVTGPVRLADSATGDEPVIVSGNVIVGPLSCTGNEPAPIDEGVPNSVTGRISGQCADL